MIVRGLILCAALGAAALYGSGTFAPAGAPASILKGFSRVDVLQGRELFHERLFETNGRFCVECHGTREAAPLTRDSLKGKLATLPQLIGVCVNNPTRSRGKGVALDSREIRALRAYLITSYRLAGESQ